MRALVPFLFLLMSAAALAQTGEPAAPALASSESDDQHYGWEDPELWGSHSVSSIPDDAILLVDYETVAGGIRQRLRIYSDGYVRGEWDEQQQHVDRTLQLAPDAATEWARILSTFEMPATSYRPSSRLSNENNHVTITLHREGAPEKYAFSMAAALPSALGTLRALLDALATAIVNDRQVSNPLSTYTPLVGDVLIDPEGNEFRVSRVLETSRLVELRRYDLSSTTWVPQRDLYTMFVSVVPGGARSK